MPRAVDVYRRLVNLYPARFREEYGAPLEQQFADEYREAGGALGHIGFWVRLCMDLALSIPRELARELRQDVRYAIRVYSRRPLATALALVALTLAIGATTGVFSVVNALLLRSLPFRAPERMVQLQPTHGMDTSSGFHRWRTGSAFLEDAATYEGAQMNLSRSGESVRVTVAETSSNFFTLLGCEPVVGRSFARGEDAPGKGGVAVIGYGLWQQLFGGDGRAIGSTILLNGQPMTVVGIAPRFFDFPSRTAVWTPTVFDFDRLPKTSVTFLETVGRLKPGLTLPQAASMFEAELSRENPDALKRDAENRPRLIPLREQLAGPVRRASVVLMGGVFFVLLIACANVANLVLTRVVDRRRELVVRAALGASRARLAQQLITETVLLGLVGAAAGLLVANWAASLATAAQPAQLAAQEYSVLDWRVMSFAVGVAVITGAMFGLFPAWLIARLQPAADLVRVHGMADRGRASSFRMALVVLQVSLTVVLVAGSFVMGRSFLRMVETDLGFRPGGALAMTVSLVGTAHDTENGRRAYCRDVLEGLRAVPGVESAAAVDSPPLATASYGAAHFPGPSRTPWYAVFVWASRDYFRTMGSEIVAGRDFNAADNGSPERVAIVDERFARGVGSGRSILGTRVVSSGTRPITFKVVGIVRAVDFRGPGQPEAAQVFMPLERSPPPSFTLVARVRGDAAAYLARCRAAVRSVDKRVAVFDVTTLDGLLSTTLAKPRFYTTVVVFFGAFALLLASMGIYGVASYSIAQRTHEIGVRMALGGTAAAIRAMLARETLLPVAAGLLVGVCGSLALGGIIGHLVTPGQAIDVATCGAAACLLAVIAAIAAWSATQRIIRLQAMEILRAE
jgi:putative ABC transport system permease protein